MKAQQAVVTLRWFIRMGGGLDRTVEDIQVIEECILPILKDNHEIIPSNDLSYHQLYDHWMIHYIPKLKKNCE